MRAGSKFVVSVVVADRTGIIRDVSTAIADLGGNIDGVRQTVVEGWFSITLTAALPAGVDEAGLRAALDRHFTRDEASIVVRPFRPVKVPSSIANGTPYVLSITGEDKPGILKRATAYLADKGINIEDFEYMLEGATVTYIGHLTVPRKLHIRQVQEELRDRLAELGMRCTLQHENIFRATNEVGPIRALLREDDHARQA